MLQLQERIIANLFVLVTTVLSQCLDMMEYRQGILSSHPLTATATATSRSWSSPVSSTFVICGCSCTSKWSVVQCRNLISTEYRPKSAIKYEIPHLESQVSSKISLSTKKTTHHTVRNQPFLYSRATPHLWSIICSGHQIKTLYIVFSKVPSDSLVSTCFLSVVVSQHQPEPARNDTFLFLFFLCADCFIQIQDDHTWGANIYNTSGLLILVY